jgi:hypothetical protein
MHRVLVIKGEKQERQRLSPIKGIDRSWTKICGIGLKMLVRKPTKVKKSKTSTWEELLEFFRFEVNYPNDLRKLRRKQYEVNEGVRELLQQAKK